MTELLHSCTSFFHNYEDREDAFRQLVDLKLARRYGGPALFWKDFSHISSALLDSRENDFIAYITSNPRDCLAFATARQVLMAAFMAAGQAADEKDITETVQRFAIAGQLSQPIRTLSGGETVKLALAKTHVAMKSCAKMVISSPFTWLSAGNRHLLEDMVQQGGSSLKQIALLALDGEDDLSAASPGDPLRLPSQAAIPFSMEMAGVRVPLALSLNPLAAAVPHAAIKNTSLHLESPCLLAGENGQGKSLVARALAGSLSFQGTACIRTAGQEGTASLLFQDVLNQTLLRSFDSLASSMRGVNREAVLVVYTKIQQEYALIAQDTQTDKLTEINDPDEDCHTLLDIKTVLVAARLAAFPAALILDEPDWGLTRRSSIGFVSAVLSVAHRQKTPVILISHKPWWQPIIKSCISVSRITSTEQESAEEPRFTIHLETRDLDP